MKKIYTLTIALVLISISLYSQDYTNTASTYTKTNVMVERSSKVQMNVVGNPVKDNIVLQISNPYSTQYEICIFSNTGRKVSTTLYNHQAGVSTKNIYVSELQRGLYFLVLTSKNEQHSMKVVLQ